MLDAVGATGERFMAACRLQMTSNVSSPSQQLSRTRQEEPSEMFLFVLGDFLWCCIVWSGYKQTKMGLLTGTLFIVQVLVLFYSNNVRCVTIQNVFLVRNCCIRHDLFRTHIKFQGPNQLETIFQRGTFYFYSWKFSMVLYNLWSNAIYMYKFRTFQCMTF